MKIRIFFVIIILQIVISTGSMEEHKEGESDSTMKAWVMDSYGQVKDLKLKSIKKPVIKDGNDVLIKISAASVNPIDNLMITGYAKTLLNYLRFFANEFPLVVGRDFSGVIVEKGYQVGDELNVGDGVYGLIPLHKQGCFSEFVIADKRHILKIPEHLTFPEAASILYAAMTAWCALYSSGKYNALTNPETKVLILGASGGVGTQAVQIIKAEGATVVGTCSDDAVSLVRSLGADFVFNYRDENYIRDVAAVGKYDVILDCANLGFSKLPETWKYSVYITLNAPVVNYTDWYGAIPGLFMSLGNYLSSNIGSWMKGQSIHWGFFNTNPQGLANINKQVEKEKIKPVIQQTFKFMELPSAMNTFAAGHLRGKIVVDFT